MKTVILITIFLFTIKASCQESQNTPTKKEKHFIWGIKANTGKSEITETYVPSSYNFKPDNIPQNAYNFGITLGYYFGKSDAMNLEILYNQVNGFDHLSECYITPIGVKLNPGNRDISRQINYLTLPFYYSHKFSNFKFGIGVQASFALNHKETEVCNISANELPYYTKVSDAKIIMPDVGPKVVLFYEIFNRIFIDLDYYYGVTPINQHSAICAQTVMTQEATVGIGFFLIK